MYEAKIQPNLFVGLISIKAQINYFILLFSNIAKMDSHPVL